MPYNLLLALYFVVRAAQKGTTRVLIPNDMLRCYFFGNEKGRRLSEAQITKWAETLKPILHHKVRRSQYGPYVILHVNEQQDPCMKAKPVRLFIPDRATVHKTLGLESAKNFS